MRRNRLLWRWPVRGSSQKPHRRRRWLLLPRRVLPTPVPGFAPQLAPVWCASAVAGASPDRERHHWQPGAPVVSNSSEREARSRRQCEGAIAIARLCKAVFHHARRWLKAGLCASGVAKGFAFSGVTGGGDRAVPYTTNRSVAHCCARVFSGDPPSVMVAGHSSGHCLAGEIGGRTWAGDAPAARGGGRAAGRDAVLVGFGQALGRGASISGRPTLRRCRQRGDAPPYPRLFEPAVLANGLPNPRHISPLPRAARAAALRGARRNGVRCGRSTSLSRGGFAPTRVEVALAARGVRGGAAPRAGSRSRRAPRPRSRPTSAWPSAARRTGAAAGMTARSPTGWASRCAPTWRRRSTGWPRRRARDGLALSITSAFRSDAEQARLFAANPNPKWVAPPGTSLHRYGHRARPRPARRLRAG